MKFMRGTRLDLLGVLVILFFSLPANAYYYTKHNTYTILAYELFTQCPSVELDLPIAHLANGTEWEDSTQPLTRTLNWHFYKSNPDIHDTWFTYRSFHNIYARRINELQELINSRVNAEDILVAAGRVLHYIQDVAVPAHVVPVFHGPFPFPQDQFDNYEFPVETNTQKSALAFTKAECAFIQTAEFDYQTILSSAAEDTLAAIEAPIRPSGVAPIDAKWTLYWQEKDSWFLSGFGSYGEVGNYFGEEVEIEQCADDGCVVQKADYDHFYRARLKAALINTARFIFFINKQINANKTNLSSN